MTMDAARQTRTGAEDDVLKPTSSSLEAPSACNGKVPRNGYESEEGALEPPAVQAEDPSDDKPAMESSSRVTLLQRIGTTAFWSFLVVSCFVMFAGALIVFLVTALFDKRRLVLHLYSCFWAQLYFYVNPIWKLRIEGRERLPWRGPAVLVSNHQSLGDILVLFGLYRPYKWVSKASVFKVPLVGWNMRLARYIPLVRGNRSSIERMMAQCRYWLEQGVPILMFPEGTRSKDGSLLPFKEGAFRLAVEAGCPVIPIALNGTAATLPKHGFLIRRRANCKVRVLPPVHPRDVDNDVGALKDKVVEVIDAERLALEAESRAEREG